MKTFAIVDDEESTLKSIYDSVLHSETQNEFQPLYTKDPSVALGWVRDNSIDAVVSDFNLENEVTGLELLKNIRRINPSIPKILFSASPSVQATFKKDLHDYNIRFIHKSNKHVLFEQIIDVLSKVSRKEGVDNSDTRITNTLKDMYLEQLNKARLSGVEILIPNEVTGIPESNMSVDELIENVKTMTPIGEYFLINWIKGKQRAESIRSQKKTFWERIVSYL